MRKMEIICNMFENSQVHLIYICIEGVMQIFHFAGYNTKNKTFSTCYQHDLDLSTWFGFISLYIAIYNKF